MEVEPTTFGVYIVVDDGRRFMIAPGERGARCTCGGQSVVSERIAGCEHISATRSYLRNGGRASGTIKKVGRCCVLCGFPAQHGIFCSREHEELASTRFFLAQQNYLDNIKEDGVRLVFEDGEQNISLYEMRGYK